MARHVKELSWEKLETRREKQKLKMFYKIKNNQTPEILKDHMPPTVAANNPYNVRSRENLATTRTRTSTYYDSFYPATARSWNQLPDKLKHATSFEQFCEGLPQIPKKESYYYAGTR